jgi:hypothetical protein
MIQYTHAQMDVYYSKETINMQMYVPNCATPRGLWRGLGGCFKEGGATLSFDSSICKSVYV